MSVVPPGAFPPPNSRYSPPCDSRLAEGKLLEKTTGVREREHVATWPLRSRLSSIMSATHHTHINHPGCIRGSYVGALWGLFFHHYDVKPLPEGEAASRARVLAHTFRIRAGRCIVCVRVCDGPDLVYGPESLLETIHSWLVESNQTHDLTRPSLRTHVSGRVPALLPPRDLPGPLQRVLLRGREDHRAAQLVRTYERGDGLGWRRGVDWCIPNSPSIGISRTTPTHGRQHARTIDTQGDELRRGFHRRDLCRAHHRPPAARRHMGTTVCL